MLSALSSKVKDGDMIVLDNINVEEYKYLCGYPSEQKLMSRNFEAKMRRNVQRAQQARKEKRRAENA